MRIAGLDFETANGMPGSICAAGCAILEDGAVVIETAAGETLRFPRKDVAVVRPLIEFDEEDLQDDAPARPSD